MNFGFHNPPRLILGSGSLAGIGDAVNPHGKQALPATNGNSCATVESNINELMEDCKCIRLDSLAWRQLLWA